MINDKSFNRLTVLNRYVAKNGKGFVKSDVEYPNA